MWPWVAVLLLAPSFEDATAHAGLEGARGDRFCFADLDADGDPDLVIAGQRLYRNVGGRFREEPGALEGARGGGAACADLDGDGRKDLVTLGGDLFLQRADGTFRRTELAFPERQAALAIADLDRDGRPDLVTGGGEIWHKDNTNTLFPRRVLRNLGKGRFEDATDRFGFAREIYGRSLVAADFDDDGDADLYVGNYRLAANELWVNGASFVEEDRGVRGQPRRHEGSPECFGHTIGASWADLDADGWLDLWVSNLVHTYVGPAQGWHDIRGLICDDSNVYRNVGPPYFRFEDRRATSGIAPRPRGGRDVYRGDELWSNCACADFDNDGLVDVFVTQVYDLPYAHSLLFRNRGDFRFEEADPGFRVFNGYGAAWADVDGDGRMDLVTGGAVGDPKGRREVRLWRNTTAEGRWIGLRFAEPVLGAVVRVLTPTRVLVAAAEATMGSHAQSNSDILHFGLGDEDVLEVRVAWPGGTEQLLGALEPGRVHVVRRAPWKGPVDLRVLRDGDRVACRPAVPGARYHWDFDDDFRDDAVTKGPAASLPAAAAEGPRRVTLRVFVRSAGRRVRALLE